jgi:hypothetical protein
MQRHFKYIALLILTLSVTTFPSVAQDNPVMKQMEKHLDLDGEALMLQDFSTMQAQMENTRSMFTSEMMKTDDPEAVDFFSSFFNLMPSSLAAVGASGKNTDGFFRIKACLALTGEKDAVIKAVTPLAPHTQAILQYAPPETVCFYSADIDFHAVYQIIESESKNWKSEEAKKGWEDFKNDMEENIDLTTEEIMKGYGKEAAFILQPGENLENNAENACIVLNITNPEFFNDENTKPDEDETMEHVKKNGFDIWYYEKKNPADGSGTVLAWDGKYAFLCDRKILIDAIIKAKTTGANLTTQEEFKRLTADLPEKNNGLTYVSGKWKAQLSAMLKREMESNNNNIYFDPAPALEFFLPFLDGMAAVRVSRPDAITWQAHLPQGSDKNIVTALLGPSATVGGSGAAVMAVPVLAATSIPNFLEAQNRAKVARTKADMRSTALGIESYYVDYNKYPESVVGKESLNGKLPETHPAYWMPTFKGVENKNGEWTAIVCSPVAYIAEVPDDPFSENGEAALGYYTPDGKKWILFSPGPDKDYDIDPEKDLSGNPAEALKKIEALSYDPTNGSISNGDIFYHGAWK